MKINELVENMRILDEIRKLESALYIDRPIGADKVNREIANPVDPGYIVGTVRATNRAVGDMLGGIIRRAAEHLDFRNVTVRVVSDTKISERVRRAVGTGCDIIYMVPVDSADAIAREIGRLTEHVESGNLGLEVVKLREIVESNRGSATGPESGGPPPL